MSAPARESLVCRVRKLREEGGDWHSLTAMMGEEEGWHENYNEFSIVRELDPNCWLVAENDTGEVIGHCVALRTSPGMAGVGEYLVAKDWRGRGVGRALWGALLDEVGGVPLVLGTEDHNLPMYSRRGFHPLYRVAIVGGPLDKKIMVGLNALRQAKGHVNILPLDQTLMGKLCEYDTRCHASTPREDFLRRWLLDNKTCHVLAAVDADQNVIGFGALHHAEHQHRRWYVSPLYADSADVARRLLLRVLERVPDGDDVFLFMVAGPENPLAVPVAEEVGLVVKSRRNFIATNADEIKNSLLLDKVYALSTTLMLSYT